MRKVKVLHLITGLNVGGAEKVVYDLSKEMEIRGHNVYVVGISEKNFLVKMFQDARINVQVLGVKKKISSFIKGLIFLRSFVKKNNIKIIHAHMTHSLIMAFFIKILNPRIKIVFTSHNFNLGSKLREIIIYLLKNFRSADIVFSEKMKKYIYKNNTVVIPNGIDTSLYKLSVQKSNTFTYLSIGRIEKVKNHKFLVDAALELQKEFNFQIHIIGDGVLKEELVSYIGQNKLERVVKLLGYRSDINTVCNQSHVFVMPSLWEGLPISLLEAGASSLPVISTPVGSIPELIDDSNGYLVDLDGFVEMMRKVYYEYSSAIIKGETLQARIYAQYDLKYIVDKHLEIYLSL
ncbi:glycosyltransferase [Flavobacterium sp. RSSB_23]|uniref:glycosyltransferase n=1 Tax=Flavobacterium sp. RSSB_23 TaxID=3447668 RepID=UPI003F3E9A7A